MSFYVAFAQVLVVGREWSHLGIHNPSSARHLCKYERRFVRKLIYGVMSGFHHSVAVLPFRI